MANCAPLCVAIGLLAAAPAAAINDFAPDPGFGTAGRALIGSLGPVPDQASALMPAGTGYLIGGYTVSGSTSVSGALLDANGQPVTLFGTNGFRITGAIGAPLPGAAFIDSQSRAVVALGNPPAVARFLPNGDLDGSFAGDGTWNPADQSVIFDVAPGPGGSVWVSKSLDIYANAQLQQLSPTGVPTAYVFPGTTVLSFTPFGYARIQRESDGSFWWTTRGLNGTAFDQVIFRFLASGELDTSYSGDGFAQVPVTCGGIELGRRYQSLAVLTGGMAVVRGDYASGSYLVAAFPDGTAGPARCEDANGVIASTDEIAPRDNRRFVGASFHCRGDGACGALLRQFVVGPGGALTDDPPQDLDAFTQFVATSDSSTPDAEGTDVLYTQGKAVMAGYARRSANDSDYFVVRYVAQIVFDDGFE